MVNSDNPFLLQWTTGDSDRQKQPSGWASDSPTLMCATDSGYVQPLAAALASVAEHFDQESERKPLQLVLLDGGITDQQWNLFSQFLQDKKIRTIRLVATHDSVDHLSISHHISHTAYFRLLSSQWLPDWIEKVIYLDCDTIVLDNISELWSLTEANQNEVWAVPDVACPFIDAKMGCESYKTIGPYLAAVSPVANYSDFGIPGDNLYFNSGVMVLNLTAWRANNRSQELLDCLANNQKHVWCWDQYALNAVFAEHWGQLPLRWNFGSHVYDYPLDKEGLHIAPLMNDQFREMQINPAVIHFTTEIKPWHYYCFHPLKDIYFKYLDQTPWSDCRPSRPGFATWWHVQTFKFQKQLLALSRRAGL